MHALANEIYSCASNKLGKCFQTSNGRLLLCNLTNIPLIFTCYSTCLNTLKGFSKFESWKIFTILYLVQKDNWYQLQEKVFDKYQR